MPIIKDYLLDISNAIREKRNISLPMSVSDFSPQVQKILSESTYVNLIPGASFAGFAGDTLNLTFANISSCGNHMFDNCTNLANLIMGPNVSLGTNTSYMFSNCSNLTNIDLSNFGTQAQWNNVTDMSRMFANCTKMQNIANLNWLNFNKCVNAAGMFKNLCSESASGTLKNFNWDNFVNSKFNFALNSTTSNITEIFYNADINLTTFNTSSLSVPITNLYGGFYNMQNLTSVNLTNGYISYSSNLSLENAFVNCTNLQTFNLGTSHNWNWPYETSHRYINLKNAFWNCCNLKEINIPYTEEFVTRYSLGADHESLDGIFCIRNQLRGGDPYNSTILEKLDLSGVVATAEEIQKWYQNDYPHDGITAISRFPSSVKLIDFRGFHFMDWAKKYSLTSNSYPYSKLLQLIGVIFLWYWHYIDGNDESYKIVFEDEMKNVIHALKTSQTLNPEEMSENEAREIYFYFDPNGFDGDFFTKHLITASEYDAEYKN